MLKEIYNSTKLRNSIRLIAKLYFLIAFLILVILNIIYIFNKNYNINLIWTISVVFFGNLFIAIFTQVLHTVLTDEDPHIDKVSEKYRGLVIENFQECIIRSLAGILEMILYTFFFAINLESIIIGYLILKTLSIWKSEIDNRKNGLYTGVLRIAVVFSLFFSLIASYFLFHFLKSSNIFELNNHFLFK